MSANWLGAQRRDFQALRFWGAGATFRPSGGGNDDGGGTDGSSSREWVRYQR